MQHEPVEPFRLRPYQIEGVERLLELTAPGRSVRAALLADEPGLGKTAQVAEYINRAKPASVLIVCPASLRLNWKYELDRWMTYQPSSLEIRSYGLIGELVENGSIYDLVVFDEAHYLKNPDAKRTKNGLALKADVRLYLTGTPVVNRPMDLFPVLSTMGIRLNRVQFGMRYCNGHLASVRVRGGRVRKVWDFSGASHQEELGDSLRKHCMVRRTKREVLRDLPEKIRQIVELDIPDGESVELKEAVARMFDAMAKAASNLSEAKRLAFEELAKARLDIARNKLPYVISFIKDLLEEETKIVVFAYHREVVEQLRLAFDGVMIYGGMTDAQKDASVRAFQQGPVRVMVGQIVAAGTGLTFTAAHTVVFAELDWVPGNVIQAEDRCHRIGQDEPVRIFHLVAQGSVDARMVRALVRKQETVERMGL